MRLVSFVSAFLPLAAHGINILQSNDDGWAEKGIRVLFDSLINAGFSSIISAPAENQSGRGSASEAPLQLNGGGCEFHSCPSKSPPTGHNKSRPEFNYVNSYPATAMSYGIHQFAEEAFGGPPDLAVAGINEGSNLGMMVLISGTVGAAVEAVWRGIPAIAFSGSTGDQTPWNAPTERYMKIYADLATTIVQALTSSGPMFLPDGVWLNVNFPHVTSTRCRSVSDYKFVLSRIHQPWPIFSDDDVEICGNKKRLPKESGVVIREEACFVSISAGRADTKRDAKASHQEFVLKKLESILTCLPNIKH